MPGNVQIRRIAFSCVVLLGAFLTFSSCSERKPLITGPDIESLIIEKLSSPRLVSDTLPIEGRILFGICRSPSLITVVMRTEKSYPCINWSIENSLFNFGHHIRIELKGISLPNICFTAVGPASASRQLSLTKGTYTLQFVHKKKSDFYRLIATDSTIRINPIRSIFTAPELGVRCNFP